MKQSISCWGWAWFLLVSCIAACGGGGSAEGGTGGSSGQALQVLETTPADMATGVATDVAVSAVFDDALRETTVTATAFTLQQGQEALQGVVSLAAEQTAAFTPDNSLALLATYTATLTTEVESLTGGTLGADYEWIFTTRDGNWGTAELVETENAGTASNPQVAIDSSGDAIAVWHQSDGAQFSIWANRYTPTGGWETAELIETDNAGSASNPQVAVDPNGNAVAVWSQSDATNRNIWSNRYTPTGGWGAAELIETLAGTSAASQVAVDPNGNAVAVWQHFDGADQNLWSNRYTPTGGWGAAELIETDSAGGVSAAQVAVDPNGNAVAVWSQDDGTRFNIWSNRYTPTGGWETAELIETDNAGDAFGPQVATDPSSNAIAVWTQDEGTRFNIWSSRYTPTGGWGIAERIEADNAGSAIRPQVAIDPSGSALAVWSQDDGARLNIWANHYTPTGGWGIAERIETDNAGSASDPQVAVDPNGNGIAVWHQPDGVRTNIWSNRYTPTGGWGIAELIETDNAGNAEGSQVAIDPSGDALAVWEQVDGTRENIWSNRFD